MAERNIDVDRDARTEFRIGVNVGDVVQQGNDIFGDGVNIAARLEALAEPGGTCVSERVREDAAGKFGPIFQDIGEQKLKNITRPIRVFRLRPDKNVAGPVSPPPGDPRQTLDRGPSLSEHERRPRARILRRRHSRRHHHGAVACPQLFVIARNSTFTYKGRAVDVSRPVASWAYATSWREACARRAAGCASRVSSSTRRPAASVGRPFRRRACGRLRSSGSGRPEASSGAIASVEQAEIARARRKPTESLDAYDCYLRGMAAFHHYTRETPGEALPLFYKALELDPNFATAYGMAAHCSSAQG